MSMRDRWRRTDDPPPSHAGTVGGVPYHTHAEYARADHTHGDGCLVGMLAVALTLIFLVLYQVQTRVDQLERLECAQHPTLELKCPPTK